MCDGHQNHITPNNTTISISMMKAFLFDNSKHYESLPTINSVNVMELPLIQDVFYGYGCSS